MHPVNKHPWQRESFDRGGAVGAFEFLAWKSAQVYKAFQKTNKTSREPLVAKCGAPWPPYEGRVSGPYEAFNPTLRDALLEL
jgi:hypothetical protein